MKNVDFKLKTSNNEPIYYAQNVKVDHIDQDIYEIKSDRNEFICKIHKGRDMLIHMKKTKNITIPSNISMDKI